MPFRVAKYFDPSTGRRRAAVIHVPTRTWYFPARYGTRAAIALCRRLNANAT